jgi:hypothetical protein
MLFLGCREFDDVVHHILKERIQMQTGAVSNEGGQSGGEKVIPEPLT